MTSEEYLSLITVWHRSKPRFVETVRTSVDPYAQAQVFTSEIPAVFDLDTAVGVQLDIVGEWIGRDRVVPHPYLDTYFRLDDPARGLDFGVWRQPFDPDTIFVSTEDDFYRRLLKTKVLINGWSGTPEDTQPILDNFFTDPETHTFVESTGQAVYMPPWFSLDTPGAGLDEGHWRTTFFTLDREGAGLDEGRWRNPLEFDDIPDALPLSITIGVAGKQPPVLELAAMAAGFVTPKPMSVDLRHSVTSVAEAPLFGLDVSNEYIAGLDQGAWGVDPEYLVALAA